MSELAIFLFWLLSEHYWSLYILFILTVAAICDSYRRDKK